MWKYGGERFSNQMVIEGKLYSSNNNMLESESIKREKDFILKKDKVHNNSM